MPSQPSPDPCSTVAPRRGLLPDQRAPAPRVESASPPAAAQPSGIAALLANAELDRELATVLLRLPATARQAVIAADSRFHRHTLAQLFALRAESALHDPSREALETAELAALIAAELPADRRGKTRQTAALAHWLLGKALLLKRQWRLAEEAFRCMFAFIPGGQPSEEAALACAGLAELHADTGHPDTATALFLSAAQVFSRLGSARPAAACLAQLGLLLLETGDLANAGHALRRALRLLGDAAIAPSLAARLHLTLAELSAVTATPGLARRHLRRARRLYGLSASPAEDLERTWREARVAAAAERHAEAEPLFERVRLELLARGSLGEAARVTLDQALLRISASRDQSVPELAAALAAAFPSSALPFAQEIAELPSLAADQLPDLYRATYDLRRRLRHAPLAAGGRPSLLVPSRTLADRLLRHRGEHEDPIGAASGL